MRNTLFNLSLIGALALSLMFSSCGSSNSHFLKDKEYRETVHSHFLERKELADGRSKELFSVLDKEDISMETKEALEFLYAYMPLSDLADYNGEFFLNQVEMAFKAREHFDWGKKIPKEIFRHFVLVYRVNNEDLDNAREVFFEELKDRVKGMSMEEAVLEVNHWAHEKVTYRATDGRTSAPLALAKTSWGRCGEESAFVTVALRAIGIPARQCYTPRWVHTDSNHAWVEAWVDGEWRYIGACEPEAELDVAWFTAPAKRAMMVHSRVYGLYDGVEEKNVISKLHSEINLLANYAEVREVKVKVVDTNNKPVEGAKVKFDVYNYADFFPLVTHHTDSDGFVSIKSGSGDIFINASKGEYYGHAKSTAEDDVLTIKMTRKPGEEFTETFVMNVPAEQTIKEIDPEKIATNAVRLAYEDSIRNAYMGTFINEEKARAFAEEIGLTANADKVWDALSKSQGNSEDISQFLKENAQNPYLFDFTGSLLDKDFRDTPAEYLSAHMANGEAMGVKSGTSKTMYGADIYSPRIGLEMIRPWRAFLQSELGEEFAEKAQSNPQVLIDYVHENITVNDVDNNFNCRISPKGVFELKVADRLSRDIFFVAAARSLGIASRLESSTGRPQYFADGLWTDILFEGKEKELPKGYVRFSNHKNNIVKPAYSTHYSIARFEEGEFKIRQFRNSKVLANLPGAVQVDAGYYRMIIGSRANDGSVTVTTRYFNVEEGKTVSQEVELPKTEGKIQIQGSVDPNTIIELQDGTKTTIKEQMNGKGLVICFADPDKEPTKHILQDLPAVRESLEGWNGGLLFAVPTDKLSAAFDASAFPNLPKQSAWMTDNNRELLNAVASSLQIEFSNNFPLVIYLNSNGGILFSSQGYRIGVGENILKTIEIEKSTKEQ